MKKIKLVTNKDQEALILLAEIMLKETAKMSHKDHKMINILIDAGYLKFNLEPDPASSDFRTTLKLVSNYAELLEEDA
jgi:hypothetical protein